MLLFAGLWCIADRDGRLEDRPRRIHAQVFPYDSTKVSPLLDKLQKSGFITRYSLNGGNYIQIRNWLTHQKPHHTEKDSFIPPCDESTVNSPLNNGCLTSHSRREHSPLPITHVGEEGGSGGEKIPKEPPAKHLLEIYQEENKVLPKVIRLTPERLKKCQDRRKEALKEGTFTEYCKEFREAIRRAQKTPFVCGENERGWTANFGWFIANHTNAYKVLEGSYTSKSKSKGNPWDQQP